MDKLGLRVIDLAKIVALTRKEIRKAMTEKPSLGPMPKHEWDGSRIRFEVEPGVWGEWVNLQGPKGPRGARGAGGSAALRGNSVEYTTHLDQVDGNVMYVGTAMPGTKTDEPKWKIKKITTLPDGDIVTQWPEGSDARKFVWNDRLGLSYQ